MIWITNDVIMYEYKNKAAPACKEIGIYKLSWRKNAQQLTGLLQAVWPIMR